MKENPMKTAAHILTAVLLGSAPFVVQSTEMPAEQSAQLAEGEIRKINKEAGKVTIKHGPLANLDMPPMTMVFQLKDPSVIDTLAVGDKIRFVAEKIGGTYTLEHVEKVGP